MAMLFLCTLVGIVSLVNSQCPAQNLPSSSDPDCVSNSIFIVDATNNVPNHVFIDEYNFLWDYVLPNMTTSRHQKTVFLSYGGDETSFPLTDSYSTACHQLYDVYQDGMANGGKTKTVLKMVQQLYSNYLDYISSTLSITMFSMSENTSDIQSAGHFVETSMSAVRFTIIALSGNKTIWTNAFPSAVVYPTTYPYLIDNNNLAYCLLCNICKQCTQCSGVPNGHPTTTPFVTTLPPTIQPVTTKKPTTTTKKTTTHAPTTTPTSMPNATVDGIPCTCNTEKVWTDVMILFDASASSGQRGLEDLLGYIQTTFAWFNIQDASSTEQFHTRVGIISYADSVQVVANLGSVTSNSLLAMQQLPYQGGSGTNIEGAISESMSQFNSSAHRKNARKVIILLATSYSPGGYAAPQLAANAFKGDNGILIVYNYVQVHGLPTDILEEIASPGYFYTNEVDTTGDLLKSLMCDANCFCPPNYAMFKFDPKKKNPTAGCYYATTTQANFPLSGRNCGKFNEGFVAQGKTQEKTQFLANQFIGATNFWAGFLWDALEKKFLWRDGSPVSGSYQPWWASSEHSYGADCAYIMGVGNTLDWVHSDCRNGYDYVCEAPACDSQHYCTDEI